MVNGAVVTAKREVVGQTLGQRQLFGDLFLVKTLVSQSQRLIVNVLVDVSLFLQKVNCFPATPYGPVMTGELNFQKIAE